MTEHQNWTHQIERVLPRACLELANFDVKQETKKQMMRQAISDLKDDFALSDILMAVRDGFFIEQDVEPQDIFLTFRFTLLPSSSPPKPVNQNARLPEHRTDDCFD